MRNTVTDVLQMLHREQVASDIAHTDHVKRSFCIQPDRRSLAHHASYVIDNTVWYIFARARKAE